VAGAESNYPTELASTDGLEATADARGQGRTAILDLLAAVERSHGGPGLRALVGLADRVGGVALGVVTGHPSRDKARAVARVRPRFEAVTMVQLRADDLRPPLRVSGALTLACADAAHFEHVWKQRVGA